MVGCRFLGMGTITDPEQASTVAASVCDALRSLADAEFSKFDEPALLAFAPTLERITRLTFAAQLQLTGEIDTRRIAASHGYPNTSALLRDTLNISATTPPPGSPPPAPSSRRTLDVRRVHPTGAAPTRRRPHRRHHRHRTGPDHRADHDRPSRPRSTPTPANWCRTCSSNTANSPNPTRSRCSPGWSP